MSSLNIKDFLSQITTFPIWQAGTGHGSFITFDMGAKKLGLRRNGTEYARGEIYLRIDMCDWDIFLDNKYLCDSGFNDRLLVNNILENFIGTNLISIKQESADKLKFVFSGNLSINAHNKTGFYEEDDTYFVLAINNKYLAYSRKSGFIVKDSEDC